MSAVGTLRILEHANTWYVFRRTVCCGFIPKHRRYSCFVCARNTAQASPLHAIVFIRQHRSLLARNSFVFPTLKRMGYGCTCFLITTTAPPRRASVRAAETLLSCFCGGLARVCFRLILATTSLASLCDKPCSCVAAIGRATSYA